MSCTHIIRPPTSTGVAGEKSEAKTAKHRSHCARKWLLSQPNATACTCSAMLHAQRRAVRGMPPQQEIFMLNYCEVFVLFFFTNGVLYLPANAECRWKKLLQVPNNLQHQPTIPFTNTCILYLPSHANMSSSFQPSYSGHLRPCQRLVSTKLKQKIRQRAMGWVE